MLVMSILTQQPVEYLFFLDNFFRQRCLRSNSRLSHFLAWLVLFIFMKIPNLSREFTDQTCEVLKHFATISSEILRPNDIKQIIQNDADKMVSGGAKVKIYNVLRYLEPETKIILLSNTRLQQGSHW